jgi:hypothetical protein
MEHNVNLEVKSDQLGTKFEQFKAHLHENKKAYIAGSSGLIAGLLIGGAFRFKIINNVTPVIAPVFNNDNSTSIQLAGHCTKIVQRLSDMEIFEQAGDAAYEIAEKHGITYDRARWMLSRHLNNKLPDVFGETYKTLALGTTG